MAEGTMHRFDGNDGDSDVAPDEAKSCSDSEGCRTVTLWVRMFPVWGEERRGPYRAQVRNPATILRRCLMKKFRHVLRTIFERDANPPPRRTGFRPKFG